MEIKLVWPPNIFTYIILGTSILILTAVFISFFCLSHQSFKKKTTNLTKKFNRVKNHNLDKTIEKIAEIAKLNREYKDKFSSLEKKYKFFSNEKIAEIEGNINNFNNRSKRSKKQINLDYKSNLSALDELCAIKKEIENDVKFFLDQETEARKFLIPIKESFRKLKFDFKEVKESLFDTEEDFEKRINETDKKLEEIENLINEGKYSLIKQLAAEVSEENQIIQTCLEIMPQIISFSLKVLPKRLEDTKEKYEELKSQDIPIHNLKFEGFEKEISKKINHIRGELKKFNYEEIKEDIKNLVFDIKKMDLKLKEEEDLKNFFEENQEELYNQISKTYKNFYIAKRLKEELMSKFSITNERKKELEDLENKIHQVERIKSDLDSYVHSLTKHPFSVIGLKAKELLNVNKDLDNNINNYLLYLKSLEKDFDKANEELNLYSISFKKNLNKFINLNHNHLVDVYELEVEQGFEKIEKVKSILNKKPINIEELNSSVKSLINFGEILVKQMKEKLSLFVMAENIIVFTNRYRRSFNDVNDALKRAEVNFEKGEFEIVIDEISDVLRSVHPEAYRKYLEEQKE